MTHFDLVCEFGQRHGGCRCAGNNKVIKPITCPNPETHRPIAAQKAETDSDRLEALCAAIAETAKDMGVKIQVESYEGYLLALHEIGVKGKVNSDAAQRALWPDDTRRGYRGC